MTKLNLITLYLKTHFVAFSAMFLYISLQYTPPATMPRPARGRRARSPVALAFRRASPARTLAAGN